jgi:hypothetical protein
MRTRPAEPAPPNVRMMSVSMVKTGRLPAAPDAKAAVCFGWSKGRLVGLGGLEPPTSSLSAKCGGTAVLNAVLAGRV